jgi:hypothetical protein
MPDARVAFTTRRAGVAVIFFQVYLSADITPFHPRFQIVVDNQVIFNTELIGGSTFGSIPGIFANNWVMPALSPGRHFVQVQWKAGGQGMHLGVRSSSNMARE